MSKKYYVLILLFALILAFVIFTFFNNPIKWKIYSINTAKDTIYRDGMKKFIDDVKMMTDGKLIIEYIPLGEKGNTDEKKIFDKVADGTLEMGFGISRYWAAEKIPGSDFWYAIPFGLNARGMYAWLNQGEGIELWKKIYAEYNVVPFPIGDTGGAMGGWFRSEIKEIKNLEGLRIRDSGLPAEVWKKLKAFPIELRGLKILDEYKKNNIDVIVALGPYVDQDYRFYNGPQYYYYPGWEEPCGLISLIINKKKWDQLPEKFQKVIEMACKSTYYYILDRFNTSNSAALLELQKQPVKFMEFPPTILDKFRELSNEVLEEEAKKNTQFAEIYRSFKTFKENIVDSGWEKIVEEAVYSETTVLKFKEDLSNATNASVNKIGNNRVAVSLNNKDVDNEIPAIAKTITDYSISIRSIMVESYLGKDGDWQKARERAKTVAEMLVDWSETKVSVTNKIIYGNTEQLGENKSTSGIEIVIEF